jgi:hypothetical protein
MRIYRIEIEPTKCRREGELHDDDEIAVADASPMRNMTMSMPLLTRTNRWREAARRAWIRVTGPWHAANEPTFDDLAARDHSLVSALCTCVLGERGEGENRATGAWPPHSVEELTRHREPRVPTEGLTGSSLARVLEQGLAALDTVAMQQAGRPFPNVNRSTQLRALFCLESGQGGMSRREAATFLDAFLALAAQVYLRDALTPARAT